MEESDFDVDWYFPGMSLGETSGFKEHILGGANLTEPRGYDPEHNEVCILGLVVDHYLAVVPTVEQMVAIYVHQFPALAHEGTSHYWHAWFVAQDEAGEFGHE